MILGSYPRKCRTFVDPRQGEGLGTGCATPDSVGGSVPLGETEAATCRTMKESRYLFRYFGVCAQRAEVSRFRCAYRCRYKAVEPSPRGSAAPNRRHRARMAALELATASSDSGLDATRDRTCSYSSVVRRHRCDHRPHHGQPTSVRDCVQRERSKSVRLPSNTRYVSSTR